MRIRFSQEAQSDSSLFPLQAAFLEAVSFDQIPRIWHMKLNYYPHNAYYEGIVRKVNITNTFNVQLCGDCCTVTGDVVTAKPSTQVPKISWQRAPETAVFREGAL